MELSERLYRLECECFAEPWSEQVLKEQLQNKDTVYVAAENGEELLGYAIGIEGYDDFELYRIAVLPTERRKGIGGALLKNFLGECRKRKSGAVFLEVRSKNTPAIALYVVAGFERIALRKRYYGDDDAVIFRLSNNT